MRFEARPETKDMELKTLFPDWDRQTLEKTARWGRPPGATDRLVVNMLRHRFTNYDQTSPHNFESACHAISDRYQWLRVETEMQVQHRQREQDNEDASWSRSVERAQRRERRDKAKASRAAIGGFARGDRVRALGLFGSITWLGETRVEVEFEDPKHRQRLFAADVVAT